MRSILTLVLIAFAWLGNAVLHCPAVAEGGAAGVHAHQGHHGSSDANPHEGHHGAHDSGAHDPHADDCRSAAACAATALVATGVHAAAPPSAAPERMALDERYTSSLPSSDSPPPRSVA